MSIVQTLAATQAIPQSQTLCTQCGSNVSHTQSAEEAHRRSRELEAQIRLLNTKAAATADKLADYEDELQVLRSKVQNPRKSTTTNASSDRNSPPPENDQVKLSQPPRDIPLAPPPGPSRLPSLSSLLPGRRNAAAATTTTSSSSQQQQNTSTQSPPIITSTGDHHPAGAPDASSSSSNNVNQSDLSSLLEAEKKARLAAESSLSQAHGELEELTAQLFSQANEMVATERKARARLEERIEVLENRDGEKKQRLDRLEKAVGRIERVRGMLLA